MRTLAAAVCLLLPGLLAAGCSQPVDLKQAVQLTDVSGGYHDAGIVDGRNKIVPVISFRLTKSTDQSLRPLAVNVLFKKLPLNAAPPAAGQPAAEEDWDEVFKQTVDFNGNQTDLLTVRATAGYTGDPPQSRADILHHSLFQDVRVHIFVKHSSSQWVEIGHYDLPRQLVSQ